MTYLNQKATISSHGFLDVQKGSFKCFYMW